uniref:uncharacterized protein LOC101298016 n=1 Tax=Fragaria vesca subsp. vesca TaxID=101020 RepID=UPI0005CAA245|nr:PREDICTED: uncharacterized protein LOC101298016 [Fragaria vesca subsp. vesca]
MDKTWMKADRRSLQFNLGFNQFLKVALDNARNPNNIPCPCLKCHNNRFGNIQFIKDHVYFNGIMQNYTRWKWHEECSYAARHYLSEGSETVEQIPDLGGNEDIGVLNGEDHEISPDSNEFMQFVEDGDKPLYPGCTKSTKMNGSVNLAKKTLSALGMKYEKIDVCPNDCILYRDLNVDAKKCPSCNASRWKLAKDGSEKVGVPTKTLWGRKKDGMMRHPANSPTWKMVNTNWPDFGIEPRNLRLALSSDGFNPYGAISSKYSCWPVILITYNLPPWLCMKRKYMMLTLLISGPKQPRNDIDVYLQPLVDDLKVLWDGIEQVYDSVRGEYFKLKAVLLWTINDFPAYGNLSGCVVKGYNACPICVDQTKPYRLKHSKKLVFWRNRRQLPRHHPYLKQASAFDNTIEKEDAPTPLTGEETFARVQGLPKASGKGNAPAPYKGPPKNRPCWKKKSVFYELDCLKFLPVRHNLDVMHIEKNCCDAILGTLLNIPGKTKDGVAARLGMVDMGICTDLKPTAGGPSRFSSNIRNLVSVNDLKLGNLKSHDCHVIMQLLLPVAIRSVLEKPVRWMYPFERYMNVFKGMVHNRTFPEGCIAECYIVEETVEFLEERMLPEDATTIGSLKNCEDAQPYFKEHMEFLELSFPYNINNPKWMKDKQNQTFPDWFKKSVANEIRIADNEVPETIRWLAGGPNKEVPTFRGYHVNGVDFNTMERDSKRSVQNSGVFLVADAMQVASAKDKRPTTVDMDFYGRIQQIWEVDYYKFRIKDETVYSATERARAVALRMKAMAMKRSRSKYASPVKSSSQHPSPVKTASKAVSPKKRTSPSPKKRKAGSNVASPKKRKGGSRARKTASPKKRTSRRLNVIKSMSKSSNNSQQA